MNADNVFQFLDRILDNKWFWRGKAAALILSLGLPWAIVDDSVTPQSAFGVLLSLTTDASIAGSSSSGWAWAMLIVIMAGVVCHMNAKMQDKPGLRSASTILVATLIFSVCSGALEGIYFGWAATTLLALPEPVARMYGWGQALWRKFRPNTSGTSPTP